jgi:hypothetical protein
MSLRMGQGKICDVFIQKLADSFSSLSSNLLPLLVPIND